MAAFDVKTYLTLVGQGEDALGAVGTVFGVPKCMMDLGRDVLALLPTETLFGVLGEMENGQSMADGVVKGIMSQIRNVLGIIEWDSEDGTLRFVSNSSKMGYESNFTSMLGSLGAFINAVAGIGAGLYANYLAIKEQIDQILDCIKQFKDYLKGKQGATADQVSNLDPTAYADFINTEYMLQMRALKQAIDAYNAFTNQINNITDIISSRADGSEPEPAFACEAFSYLSGTGLASNCLPPAEPTEIFRLVYGPPRAIQGQFILSNDGVYFDSQSSGIIPALTYVSEKSNQIKISDRWKFSQDANEGGRGTAFSTEDLKLYVNTLLDPKIIDDSSFLKNYYDKDGFLQELINNKNKRIYDLSSQINELESDSAPESVIFNQKQALMSENTIFQNKINKRKKQIELAVKMPDTYSNIKIFKPGEIPVNDFSYLAGLNIALDLQKQKALSFSQVEIDGVVSPIKLKSNYIVSKVNSKDSSIEHLIISDVAGGAIIYDGSSVSSTNAVVLQAENFLTTDSLISMYNFLDTNIEDPSSTSFTTRNAASQSNKNYAQLVGNSQEQIFKVGLGVPFLEGITKHSRTNPTQTSSLGSYVKLPRIKEFSDLLYNQNGATVDFWIHMPNLMCVSGGYNDGPVSSLFRLVLSNENTGFDGTPTGNTEAFSVDDNSKSVKGFMMGFTRDVRLTADKRPSLTSNPVVSSVFFIAPTQSLSASSVGFINRSQFDGVQCGEDARYHSMIQKVTEVKGGVSISSCENEFCHMAVTFDRVADTVKFYLDGVPITTSSMSYIFGIPKYQMPNIPTFKKSNSFQYSSTTVNSNAPNSLKYGPRLDRYFTPWIVGGGYTDGMYQYGNFMGGIYGGIKSGLNGHLGSLKFYSKPLSDQEVMSNYKTQKDFFKNIDVSLLGPTPCQD
jgi:hypothetical protein